MANVIDKITKLLRLTTSDNENEARNCAVTAARLILEHKVTLSLPTERDAPHISSTPTAPPVRAVPPRRVRDHNGGIWFFHEHGIRFSGSCGFCGLPTMVGHATYVSDTSALHVGCWNERQTGKIRPGPAPVASSSRPVVENMRPRDEEERRAVADLFSKLGYDK